jgi:hypothetical protein
VVRNAGVGVLVALDDGVETPRAGRDHLDGEDQAVPMP